MAPPLQIDILLTHKSVPCWSLTEEQADRLASALSPATVRRHTTPDSFAAAMRTSHIAIAWRFAQEWIDHAACLRWIVTPAAGRDYFDVQPPPGVEMIYGEFHGPLMAETVVGMMLGECRGLFEAARLQATDPWPRATLARHMRSLHGSHTVILGFGNIGTWIGRMLKPFGVRITGIRRHVLVPPSYFEAEDALRPVTELDAILPEADHLVLVLPGGEGTEGIMDGRRLQLLPGHAVVYNVGRGNALEEGALAEALDAGRLGGAYLDVFGEEPLPGDSPLRGCRRAHLFPHASAITPLYLDRFVEELVPRVRSGFPETFGGGG